MVNTIGKKIIVLIILAVVLLTGAIPAFSSGALAYAETDRHLDSDEVTSLEELCEVPTEQIASWSKYDSRDYGIVTSVKDQGSTYLCWAYGSLAAMETNILRQGFSNETKDTIDLDEKEFVLAVRGKWDDPLNIADTDNNRKSDSEINWNAEGAISMAAQFASRGQGVYQEGEITENTPQERYSSYYLRSAVTCGNDVDEIKKLIAAYGGVAFAYHSGLMNYDYYYATGGKDHASFIIGWDDDIDSSVFKNAYGTTPQRNGGWIVKNSYGTGNFIDGYFYLSYDSQLFELTAFEMMSAEEYDFCYNYSDKVYDTASYSSCSPDNAEEAEYAAIYKAQKGDVDKEYLKAVSVGVSGSDMQISVSVYTDVVEDATNFNNKSSFDPKKGNLVATATYYAPSTGIYTIPLTKYAELNVDSYFTVLVQVSGGTLIYDRFAYRSATMTYVLNGGSWDNLSSPLSSLAARGVLCIKALTVTQSEDEIVDISSATLTLSETSFVYNGAEHKPTVTVQVKGETLSANCYTVDYVDNIYAGTATVTVTGIGKYTGSAKTTFTIDKADCPNLPDEYKEITVDKAETLADIELPENWTWGDENAELIVGEQTVYAHYIGADKDNYTNKVVAIKLTVQSLPNGNDDPKEEDPNEEQKPDDEQDPNEEGSNGVEKPDTDTTQKEETPTKDSNSTKLALGLGLGLGVPGVTGISLAIYFLRKKLLRS